MSFILLIIINVLISNDLYFSSYDEVKIRYKVYNTNENLDNEIILFIQGRQEFIEKYEHFYEYLNLKGFTVYASDLRGQGKSEGLKCYIDTYDTYIKDLDFLINNILSTANKKINIISHSTGGLISILYLIKYNNINRINKVILLSPFLGLNNKIPNFFIKLFSILNNKTDIIKSYKIDETFETNKLTDDVYLYNKYSNNSLKCGRPTYAWLIASINAINFAFKNIDKNTKNVLIIATKNDKVVDSSKSKKFCLNYKNCNLIEFEYDFHELLNIKDREKIFKLIGESL